MKRTNLLKLLEDFRTNKLYLPGTDAGTTTSEKSSDTISKKEKLLMLELKKTIKNNGDWLKYIYGILTALLILLSIFLWRKQDNMTYFFAILGGQGASIIFCINRLSYFFKQKRASEILLHLYQGAETSQVKDKILDEIISFLRGK